MSDVIRYAFGKTSLGDVLVATSDKGVVALEFVDDHGVSEELLRSRISDADFVLDEEALPGAVRASLAPYNTQAEVERFVDAVTHIARGRIKSTYEQAADGTFAPAGGWPRIPSPLHTLVSR